MIQLVDKKNCCGCHACLQVCPKRCISMTEDNEGFLYPSVDIESCIDCGLCEQVCPMFNPEKPQQPLEVHAAKNPDVVVRMDSSSGGVFSALAEQVIAEGGVVFGAKYDESYTKVVHAYAETKDAISVFRRSKYAQSEIGNTYKEAETFLKQGREVLYSGTPCQIAGLKHYLRREYDKLLTIDIVCHGVPSPLVWREYLKSIVPQEEKVRYVNMRDKRNGWSSYCIAVRTDKREICMPASKCVFIEGFLRDLYLRPSCYNCSAKSGRSGSDITLGDFWGVANLHSECADEGGVSLALAWSREGVDVVRSAKCSVVESNYNNVKVFNPSIERNVAEPKLRGTFWERFEQEGVAAIEMVCRELRPSLFSRVLTKVKNTIRRIICGRNI